MTYKEKRHNEALAAFALGLPLAYYHEEDQKWHSVIHTDAIVWSLFDIAPDYENISEQDQSKLNMLSKLICHMKEPEEGLTPVLLNDEDVVRLYSLSTNAVGNRTIVPESSYPYYEEQIDAIASDKLLKAANDGTNRVYTEVYTDGSSCLKFSEQPLEGVSQVKLPSGYKLVKISNTLDISLTANDVE